MIKNDKDNVQENDKFLTVIMTLLNISVVALVGVVVWSVLSIAEKSAAITKIMNGSFMP